MVGEDRVIMSVKELRRVHVLRHALEKKITQGQAGEVLGLTARHIRRLLQRVRAEGDAGLVHRGRGKPSNRRMPAQVKAKVLGLCTPVCRFWADVGGGEAGGAAWAHAQRRAPVAAGARGRSFHAAETPAPGVAGAEAPRGGTGAAGRLPS